MNFYGKAEQAAQQILSAFEHPETLPAALAQVYIHKDDLAPCRKWSINNQMLCALAKTADARGFQQWKDVGRSVKKGSKAFYILAPSTRKVRQEDTETGKIEDALIVTGFIGVPVFRYEDTEGAELDIPQAKFLPGLPMLEVARAWGLEVDVTAFAGEFLGRYAYQKDGVGIRIELAAQSMHVWAHELVHAADHKLHASKFTGFALARKEVVAELGGAVLLHALGYSTESDLGGVYRYIQAFGDKNAVKACMDVLSATCEAVNLILSTSEQVKAQAAA